MPFPKQRMSFWQIINMNVGFFGIQYSFGLQQTAINPLYTFLHAKPEHLAHIEPGRTNDGLADTAADRRTER